MMIMLIEKEGTVLSRFNLKAKTDHISKSMWKKIASITLPAFLELVLSTLFGMVDMMMVGQLSSAAIASVGLTNQPFMLLLAVFAAVNVGTTTLVAWNVGAGNVEKASSITRQALIINAALGIVMSILGVVLSRNIVLFMGANSETLEYATSYFQIVAAGLVFQAVTMAITASLRGVGETKISMFYNIGSNLLNVFGNYVLIYGKFGFPEMGVTGAATSTTIARLLACLAGLYVISLSNKSKIHVPIKASYKLNLEIIKKMFSIGLPAALEQLIIQSGLMMFARTVSSLGTAGFAAHQIGLNISGLTFAPSMAFGVAATTLVGQSLGANDTKKAKEYADIIHHISVLVACFIGLLYFLFAYPMARLYTNDLTVAAMAVLVLRIVAFAQPGQSTQLSLAGALRGAGDTMYPLYASAFGIWIFRVAIAYVFVSVLHWGLVGAWVALVMDQYARAAIIYFRYHSGKWKYIKAKAETVEEVELCL
ncbi:MAG: family efflux transporter [Clostridia bacterium]|jgi:putative MATE family efflux protein|nr:family efflux transporter [Clostridia bacterium]